MNIETQEDWWNLAEATVPKLEYYAYEMSTPFDAVVAMKLLSERNHKALWSLLHKFWWELPDAPFIRVQPFFDLCDLCSENWVFDEDHTY